MSQRFHPLQSNLWLLRLTNCEVLHIKGPRMLPRNLVIFATTAKFRGTALIDVSRYMDIPQNPNQIKGENLLLSQHLMILQLTMTQVNQCVSLLNNIILFFPFLNEMITHLWKNQPPPVQLIWQVYIL